MAIIWHVWCIGVRANRFFASKEDAERHIETRYGPVRLHPTEDDNFHVWTRENYGGMMHHPDGLNLWIAWTKQCIIHLERHEVEATSPGIARALNELR